jgi:alkyl hydroperoxide reductase subunit D
MGLDHLKTMIPDYAKDIKLNLSSLANDETLTTQQLWGCMFSAALASGNNDVIAHIMQDAMTKMDEIALNAAKSAAAIMAMNNIYYRFVHISDIPDFQTMPAKLRMNVIGNPGVDKADFELWSTSVSVVNGCGMCIDAHAKTLMDHGITKEQVQTSARIAAVIHAVARVLDGEVAMSSAANDQAQAAA